MNAIWFLVLGIGWLAIHCTVYSVILRFRAVFRREGVILRYHVVSFFLFLILNLLLVACSRAAAITAAGLFLVSIHAIYSLTFLELWALSEGGYSLRILHELDHTGMKAPAADGRLGSGKLAKRLASLQSLGLVREAPAGCRLTFGGRCAAMIALALLRLTAGRSLNP